MTVGELRNTLGAFPDDWIVVFSGEADYVECSAATPIRLRSAEGSEMRWCDYRESATGPITAVALENQ